eukprot:9072943-Lingulodinium_polyedra.AAC.1
MQTPPVPRQRNPGRAPGARSTSVGAGQTMATPPCLPPRGPGLDSEAATRARGMRPALQVAAAK